MTITKSRLTAIGEPFLTIFGSRKHTLVVCQCVCGKIVAARLDEVISGHISSCGCSKKGHTPHNKTHGQSKGGDKLYGVWMSMKGRCSCETNPAYKWYGAKGVKVCDAWSGDFTIFRDWCYATGYKPGLHLDRKKSHLGYNPENCQWLTPSQNVKKMNTDRDESHAAELKAKDVRISYLERYLATYAGVSL